MKRMRSAILKVTLLVALALLTYISFPIGWNMSWDHAGKTTLSVALVLGPLILTYFSSSSLINECLAAGKPINASALEPEVVYIVEGVIVRRVGNYVASLAVLKKAVLESGEIDKQTDRLLVFFPDKELREGGQVMGVTTKWFEAFSKTGASSETTLVLVGSQA